MDIPPGCDPLDHLLSNLSPNQRDRLDLLRVIAVTRGVALDQPTLPTAQAALLVDQLLSALFTDQALTNPTRHGRAFEQVCLATLSLAAGHQLELSEHDLDQVLTSEPSSTPPTHRGKTLRLIEHQLTATLSLDHHLPAESPAHQHRPVTNAESLHLALAALLPGAGDQRIHTAIDALAAVWHSL